MTRESSAQAVKVEFDPKKEFSISMRGEQIKFLLSLIEANQYPGSRVFLVGDTISALQQPFLDDAHGAVSLEE